MFTDERFTNTADSSFNSTDDANAIQARQRISRISHCTAISYYITTSKCVFNCYDTFLSQIRDLSSSQFEQWVNTDFLVSRGLFYRQCRNHTSISTSTVAYISVSRVVNRYIVLEESTRNCTTNIDRHTVIIDYGLTVSTFQIEMQVKIFKVLEFLFNARQCVVRDTFHTNYAMSMCSF